MNGSNSTKQIFAIAILLGLMAAGFYGLLVGSKEQAKKQAEQNDKPAVIKPADPLPHVLFGYDPNPTRSKQFIRSLQRPFLAQAGPNLKADNETPVFLYRSLYKAYERKNGRPWVVGQQKIGDCVSWGFKHAAEIHLAVLYETGESSDWQEISSESIYGGSRVEGVGASRGGYSDGSYGAAAAAWLTKYGIVYRKDYPGLVDLREYSGARAKDWGNYGNGGRDDNGRLDAIAKQNSIKSVVLIRNFQEAAAAIQAGYPVAVCSGQGFSSTRDEDGFCRAQGSWAHCMVFIGVRYGSRPGLLCLNSWGPSWVRGPKFPSDQPEGSFWVESRVVNSMLSGEDSFSVSGLDGFPFRDLRNGDWVLLGSQGSSRFVNSGNNRQGVELFQAL